MILELNREVIREGKSTTKLRIVYDVTSGQSQETSLELMSVSLIPLIFDIPPGQRMWAGMPSGHRTNILVN